MRQLSHKEYWRVYFLDRDIRFGEYKTCEERKLVAAGKWVRQLADDLAGNYEMPNEVPLPQPRFNDLLTSVLTGLRREYKRRFRTVWPAPFPNISEVEMFVMPE